MTRDELFAAVRSYADRSTLGNAELLVMLASLEGELNRELSGHPRQYVTANYTLTAGKSNIPLPTDIVTLVSLRGPSEVVWMQYPLSTPTSDLPTTGYIQRGTSLEITPKASDFQFTLDYFAYLCDLNTVSTGNWLSKYHADVYLYGMLKELTIWTKDQQQGPLWISEYQRRLAALKEQGWNQNIGAMPRIVHGV